MVPIFLRPTMLLAALALGWGTAQAGGMYKWKDEAGNVHYTQTPPPGSHAEAIAPPPPPPLNRDAAEKQRERARDALTPVPPPSADIAADERAAAIARQNCEAARHNLDVYTRHRRVVNANDEVVVLDDDTRAAKLRDARKQIEKFCR